MRSAASASASIVDSRRRSPRILVASEFSAPATPARSVEDLKVAPDDSAQILWSEARVLWGHGSASARRPRTQHLSRRRAADARRVARSRRELWCWRERRHCDRDVVHLGRETRTSLRRAPDRRLGRRGTSGSSSRGGCTYRSVVVIDACARSWRCTYISGFPVVRRQLWVPAGECASCVGVKSRAFGVEPELLATGAARGRRRAGDCGGRNPVGYDLGHDRCAAAADDVDQRVLLDQRRRIGTSTRVPFMARRRGHSALVNPDGRLLARRSLKQHPVLASYVQV
jgi:hypothetical protein